ncbi:transposon TX1 [Tanacetum coccineum]
MRERAGERVIAFRRVGQRANGKWYNEGLREYKTKVRHPSIVSFMFFGFPDNWDTVQLWRMFRNYGWIVDLYMPKRRLRSGQRFGFVRFRGVTNVDGMERILSNINVGMYQLTAFRAKDRRDGRGNAGIGAKAIERGARRPTKIGARRDARSYREKKIKRMSQGEKNKAESECSLNQPNCKCPRKEDRPANISNSQCASHETV